MLARWFDRSPERYVPYAGHISREIALLLDGSVMAVLKLSGVAYELEANAVRNGRLGVLNHIFRHLADSNVVLYSHLVRHGRVPAYPRQDEDAPSNSFTAHLYAIYEERVLSDLRQNDWFLSIVVRPEQVGGKLVRGTKKQRRAALKVNRNLVRQLEDAVTAVQASLVEYGCRRLGIREVPTDIAGVSNTYSEIGEALMLIRTGLSLDVPLGGSLGATVYRHRVIFGPAPSISTSPGIHASAPWCP
jgi:type IV secretion system protein VirB4